MKIRLVTISVSNPPKWVIERRMRKLYKLFTDIIEVVLVTKENNTSRLSDFKKALGSKRHHNIGCDGLQQIILQGKITMFKKKNNIEKIFATAQISGEVNIQLSDYSKIVEIIRKKANKSNYKVTTKYGKLFLQYIGQREVFYT